MLALFLKLHINIHEYFLARSLLLKTLPQKQFRIFMNALRTILLLLLLLCVTFSTYSQENATISERTPEQEASIQTEKLQQELNLTAEQNKQMYEINLRYERQRQVSNTRSEAMQRIKNKNADIRRILNEDQSNRLQNKRYERSTFNSSTVNINQSRVNSSSFRSSSEFRTNSSRNVSTDLNVRNNYRSTDSRNQNGVQPTQTDRRSATSLPRATPVQSNPYSTRSAISTPPTQTRTESYSAPQNNTTQNQYIADPHLQAE